MQTIHLDDENTKSRLVSTIRLKIQEQKTKNSCLWRVKMLCQRYDELYGFSVGSEI